VVALLQRRELEMDLAERKRHPLLLLIGVAVVLILATSAASLVIAPVAKGKTYSDVRAIPHRKVGLVPGCAKQIPGGGTNPFFEKRVAAAAELYRSGKIDYLPGDIVAWNLGFGSTHIGMVVDQRGWLSNRYMILHNIGAGPKIEDVLFDWKIIGHYRYYGPNL
jgi:hypothetical protein